MSSKIEIFRLVRIVQRCQFLLEVGRFYGRFGAVLATVHWCQVAQANTRYVPRRYRPHILYHIGHWRSFGYNWWSPISSPCLRSFLRVDLMSLNKPSVLWHNCGSSNQLREPNPPHKMDLYLAWSSESKQFNDFSMFFNGYFGTRSLIFFSLVSIKFRKKFDKKNLKIPR